MQSLCYASNLCSLLFQHSERAGVSLDLGIWGYSPGYFGISSGSLCLMMKIAPEVFMWLHMERPAVTNATLSPVQIVQKLTWLSHMSIYGQSQNNYQSLSISLLFSTIAAFIVVGYYGYSEVLWKRVTPHSDTTTHNNGGRREIRVFLLEIQSLFWVGVS